MKKPERRSCGVCDEKHFSKGYCVNHYRNFHRYGSPFGQTPQLVHEGKVKAGAASAKAQRERMGEEAYMAQFQEGGPLAGGRPNFKAWLAKHS